jgi:riboflavin synthase
VSFRIGIVDTTFSRVNMGNIAIKELRRRAKDADLKRVTVPGVKDLPAAARRFFDDGCDLVIACGMVGAEEVDKVCGHEASLGLMWLRTHFGKPLLEVFIHMDEPMEHDALGKVTHRPDSPTEILHYERELKKLSTERTREHAVNAYLMLYEPQTLIDMAGTGQRQGYDDAGAIQ